LNSCRPRSARGRATTGSLASWSRRPRATTARPPVPRPP
jgi:hypothetical protein